MRAWRPHRLTGDFCPKSLVDSTNSVLYCQAKDFKDTKGPSRSQFNLPVEAPGPPTTPASVRSLKLETSTLSSAAFWLPKAEVEETLNRIKTHKGVRGVIVLGADGAVLRSTLDAQQTAAYAGAASQLSERARSLVRDLDPQNDVTFLRVRSKKHEILLAPDGEYLLLVIQDPNADTQGAATS
ncbi:dynein light chain roadblock-type 2 [Cyclospora cayetanensis]|uniref:Dynein light chain roadblock-type 2 n=1 Tax=Cyclospora cayetanensis TaxID=88456 RepID=A0A6P6RRX8_9EIME|nr:dynein light chain roadblock-type 2 [Cyclospora cayetanensis]